MHSFVQIIDENLVKVKPLLTVFIDEVSNEINDYNKDPRYYNKCQRQKSYDG